METHSRGPLCRNQPQLARQKFPTRRWYSPRSHQSESAAPAHRPIPSDWQGIKWLPQKYIDVWRASPGFAEDRSGGIKTSPAGTDR
jgi:hypothetical protein